MESKTQRTKSEQRDTTVCHYFGTTGRKREKNHAHYKTPTKAKEKACTRYQQTHARAFRTLNFK